MGEAFLDKNGGGSKINGIIEDYYVYAGENISAGSFVEFVNGVASSTTKTSSDTKLSTTAETGYAISAAVLDDNRVFIAHSYGSSTHLYGMVCTVNDTTITKGTDVALSTVTNSGQIISIVLLEENKVFIAHRGTNGYLYSIVCTISETTITAGSDTSITASTGSGSVISACKMDDTHVLIAHVFSNTTTYLYAIVCTISGTTITKGNNTKLDNASYSGRTISTVLLKDNKVFIAHSSTVDYRLNGIVCTISGTTITAGSDTVISSSEYAGSEISAVKLLNENVFIAHSYSAVYSLYGIICTISGTTIAKGTDTLLKEGATTDNSTSSSSEISTVLLGDGRVVVFHKAGAHSSTSYLHATIPTINGTTITSGGDYELNTAVGSGSAISTALFSNGTIFTAHSSDNTNYYLNAQIFGVTNGVPTQNIVIPTYETQVRNVTSSNANGIAKTSGVGGSSTAHNETVQIYVPDV